MQKSFLCLVVCMMVISACQTNEQFSQRATEKKLDLEKAGLIHAQLGLNYLKQGDITRAKSKLVYALKLAPKLPDVHSAFGYFYEKVSERALAEKYYRKAIALGKGSGKYHNNYAGFLCRQRAYAKAEKQFLKAIVDETYLHTAEVYENAGFCALDWEKPEKAKEYFHTALLHDPRRAPALLELAELNVRSGDFQQAQALLVNYAKYAACTARSIALEIQVARALGDKDWVASKQLLLKNKFPKSPEYAHLMNLGQER